MQRTCYACDWTFSTFCSMAGGFNPFSLPLSPFSTFNFPLPLSCFLFSSTAPAYASLHHPLPLSVFTKQVKGPTCYLLSDISSPCLCPRPLFPPCVCLIFSDHELFRTSAFLPLQGIHNRMPLPEDPWALPGSSRYPDSSSDDVSWGCSVVNDSCTYRDVKASACCRGQGTERVTHADNRVEGGCKKLSIATVLPRSSFLAACSAGAHKNPSGHQPCLPGTTVQPLCLRQQEACLLLELLHHITSLNHDISWLYSQTIKVRPTRAGLSPCFGGCCSKGSASVLGSFQHSTAQHGTVREVTATPEPLSMSKVEEGVVTLGMRGEGLKLSAAVLSTRFSTYSWFLRAQ